MERGLLWLPLLALFFWLAWAGWNEYQKVEAYRVWAADFDRAKYDIYAVLGQKDATIAWGKPTRQGPVDVQCFSLEEVESVRVLAGDRAIDPENPPSKGSAAIEFCFTDSERTVKIPFTEVGLALEWAKFLSDAIAR